MNCETFSDLDKTTSHDSQGRTFALGAWYESVKDKSIRDLSVDDLCRAVRQRIHLAHVVPFALRVLNTEPLAGHQYDGELLSAITRVPFELWVGQPALLRQAVDVIKTAGISLDKDIQTEVDEFLMNSNSLLGTK